MKVVIDSSVILAGLLPDEQTHYALSVLNALENKSIQGLVPTLFFTEVGNGLLMSCRRQRIDSKMLQRLLELLGALPLQTAAPPALVETALAAEQHGLTFYDASYLQLALSQKVRLATLDAALRRAAEAESALFVP